MRREMSIDVRDRTGEAQPMGRLLQLPLHTAAGDAAAVRAELVARLRERRAAVVEEMCEAVHRAGLVGVLSVGQQSLAQRLDQAVVIMLAAWEHGRPLHAAELDALAALGGEVAAAGVPLWRLLSAVHHASRAGWQYALEHALTLADAGRRPATLGQLVGDLSVELFDLVGRIESQLAAGYGDTRRVASLTGQVASLSSSRRG